MEAEIKAATTISIVMSDKLDFSDDMLVKGDHVHTRAKGLRKLVDRSTAMLKIRHHLHSHFRRERRYAAPGQQGFHPTASE